MEEKSIMRTLEERVDALEQAQRLEGTEVKKVADTDSEAIGVNDWARKKYTMSGEIAILRKTLKTIVDSLGISCPEFEEYNKYIEDHKAKVKSEIRDRNR